MSSMVAFEATRAWILQHAPAGAEERTRQGDESFILVSLAVLARTLE